MNHQQHIIFLKAYDEKAEESSKLTGRLFVFRQWFIEAVHHNLTVTWLSNKSRTISTVTNHFSSHSMDKLQKAATLLIVEL